MVKGFKEGYRYRLSAHGLSHGSGSGRINRSAAAVLGGRLKSAVCTRVFRSDEEGAFLYFAGVAGGSWYYFFIDFEEVGRGVLHDDANEILPVSKNIAHFI